MSIGYSILIAIILTLLFVVGELLHAIEVKDKEHERYCNSMRRSNEIIIEELKKDIELRDELLRWRGVK